MNKIRVIKVLLILVYFNALQVLSQSIQFIEPQKDKKIEFGSDFAIKWSDFSAADEKSKFVKVELLPKSGSSPIVISDSTKSPNELGLVWKVISDTGIFVIRITNLKSAIDTKRSDEFQIVKTGPSQVAENPISSITDDLLKVEKAIEDFRKVDKKGARKFSDESDLVKSTSEILDEIYKKVADVKNSTIKEFFKRKANTYEDLIKSLLISKKSKISIIGDAAILNSNTEGKSINGTGSFGMSFTDKTKVFEIKALINVVSSKDTIIAKFDSNRNLTNGLDFGQSVLNPFSGANSLSSGYIEARQYLAKLYGEYYNFGIQGYCGFSSRSWTDTSMISKTEKVNILSASAGVFWNILSKHIDIEQYQLVVFFQPTLRVILGDIRNNELFRQTVLGTSQKDFWGFELGFQIKYQGINAFVMLPAIFGSQSIKGITSGQFTAGISITTSIRDIEF